MDPSLLCQRQRFHGFVNARAHDYERGSCVPETFPYAVASFHSKNKGITPSSSSHLSLRQSKDFSLQLGIHMALQSPPEELEQPKALIPAPTGPCPSVQATQVQDRPAKPHRDARIIFPARNLCFRWGSGRYLGRFSSGRILVGGRRVPGNRWLPIGECESRTSRPLTRYYLRPKI